jgi:hypothetical protein
MCTAIVPFPWWGIFAIVFVGIAIIIATGICL